jgi:hypothetical protein
MSSTGTRIGIAALCLLASGACRDVAIPRVFPEPPGGSYDVATFQVTVQGRSEPVEGARITPEFIRTTTVRPMLGRAFVDPDYSASATPVVLISHDWWIARFEGGPQAIGTKVQIDGQEAVIVGVTERGFRIPKQTNVWVPRKQ